MVRPERDPVPRAHNPWGWLGGILILGVLIAGAVAASLALWENVDIRRLTRAPGDNPLPSLPDPLEPPAPAVAGVTFEVALYRSAGTAGYFPAADYYPSILDRWNDLAREAGGVVRTIGSVAQVEALEGRGLVIAPSAVCLGTDEVAAFRRHAERGGSLLLTWATGARDERCEWRGWGVVQDLTDALEVRELEQREALFLSIPTGLPLSYGIEPAARVELHWDSPLALATRGARVYWSDWALNPDPAADTEGVDTAATLRALPSGGRILWFGFTEDAAVDPLDERRLHRLLTNGLLWASGVPLAEILPWPGGNQAGLMLAQGVSGEFENVEHMARIANARDIPATYFVVSRLTRDYPDLAEILGRSGEVASQTSDNTPLAGLPLADQQTRLRRSMAEIRDWSASEPRGLRPPEESADEATLAAWQSLDGAYVVGLNGGRTASPEILLQSTGPMVLLPRAIKDDYNLIVQERVMRSPDLTAGLLEGTAKVQALGGLAVLTVNSRLASTPRHIGAVAAALDSLRTEGRWWFATGSEIAEWSLARRETALDLARSEGDELELTVRAPEDRPLEGGWVGLTLPGGSEEWEPVMDSVGVTYGESPWGVVIPLGDLARGEVRTILLRHLSR